MKSRTLLLMVTAALSLAACGSPEQRAADYLVNAQKYYDAGDYVKAKLEAQNAAQVAPKNAKARFLLANIAEQQKEYPQMFGHLQVAVAEDPDNVEARLKLGTIYFLSQSWAETDKQLEELLKRAPRDARVRVLKARRLIQNGDRAAGMAELDTALKLDPDNVEGILLKAAASGLEQLDKGLGILDAAIGRLPTAKTRQLRELRVLMLAQAKRYDEAETGLRELGRDFPEEQGYPFQLAQFYASQGRMDEAEQLLKKLTDQDPKNAERQLAYVQFLSNQGNLDKAEAALKGFIGRNPEALKLQLALAQLYEGSRRVDEARKVYVALGKRAPKSPEGLVGRFRIAALDFAAGTMDDARAGIESILKDVPDDPNALLLRAALRFRDNKFDDAVGDLRVVLRKEPNNDKALLLLATAYVRKNDLVLAKDTYRRLLEVAPDTPDGLRQLAGLYAADKEYAEAEALLRKRLAKAPDDLLASAQLVDVLLAGGSVARAEEEARRMAGLKNQTGVGDYSLGRVLLQKKDYGAAADAFRKSVAARASDPVRLEALVSSLIAAGRRGEAISALTDQVDSSADPLVAKYLLGGIYGREGDQAKAAAYLEDVVKEKPDAVGAWAALAGVYKESEDRIRVLERAMKAVPGNLQLKMLLATEFEQGGRYDDAIALYEGVVKTKADFKPAINNLAALLLDQRTDKASHARALKLAEALSGAANPSMQDTLGWAYYRAGKYPEAVALLERVVAKAGQFPVFRYHLGMAYLRAGNPVGARQQLRQAVDKVQGDFPGLAEARTTLEELDKPS